MSVGLASHEKTIRDIGMGYAGGFYIPILLLYDVSSVCWR